MLNVQERLRKSQSIYIISNPNLYIMHNSTGCIQNVCPKHGNTFTAEELWDRGTKPYTLYRTKCLTMKLNAPHGLNFQDLLAKTPENRLICLTIVS